METLDKIKLIYSFDESDALNLTQIKEMMNSNVNEFISGVYSFI